MLLLLRVEMRAQFRPEVCTLHRVSTKGRQGWETGLIPVPKSPLSQQSPKMVAPDKKKNDWLLVCGKIPGTTKGHM